MKYKVQNVGRPGNDLSHVLTGAKLERHLHRTAEKGVALFATMAPRGSQKRPHTPLALTAEASTEFHVDRWVGVVTAGASYAIASEVGNRSRPRGAHTLARVATILGNTGGKP